MSESAIKQSIRRGLEAMGLHACDEKCEKFEAYLNLLEKWNKVHNLTSIRTKSEWVSYHILDSASVPANWLGQTNLDVGSGAGLPGIPLSILYPSQHFILIDAVLKKTNFLQHVVTSLRLPNVEVVHGRVETYLADKQLDVILSRAFASLDDFVAMVGKGIKIDGWMVAMKGRRASEKDTILSYPYEIAAILPVHVPGLVGERHLVKVVNKGATRGM